MLVKFEPTSLSSTDNSAIQWSADNMDYISDQLPNYMVPIFNDLLSKKKVETVLDIGCGDGYFTSALVGKVGKISGIDGSPYGLRKALKAGFNECFQVGNIDYDDISGIGEKFDLIICKDFLEHILFPDRMIEKASQLLSENGSMLILVPNHFTLYHRIKFLFTRNLDTQNDFPKAEEWDFPHIRFFSHEGLRKLCHFKGLELIEDYSGSFFYFFPRLTRLSKLIGLDRFLLKHYPTQFTTCFAFHVGKKHLKN